MKNWSVLFLFLLVGISCTDNDDEINPESPTLTGTWLLVEQYSDPGDGSGDFEKVNSEKSIQFLEEGIFRSNGELCDLNTSTGTTSSGTYAVNDTLISQFSHENYLMPEACDTEGVKVYFHVEEKSLILSFSCMEGCAQKYQKK